MGRLTKMGLTIMLVTFAPQVLADTYRYMHVTIDTPWAIFVGLFVLVMMPFILMAILYWRNAIHRNAEDDAQAADEAKVEGKGGE